MQRKTRERIHAGFSAAKLRLYLQSFVVKCNQDFFLCFINPCFCYIFFFLLFIIFIPSLHSSCILLENSHRGS